MERILHCKRNQNQRRAESLRDPVSPGTVTYAAFYSDQEMSS